MTDIRKQKFLTVADLEKVDLEHWDWPDYEQDQPPKETAISYAASNAESAEDELSEEEVSPLTVQELDELHQQAKEEGFNLGKEEGFALGKEEGIAQGVEEGKEQGLAQGYAEGYAAGQDQINKEVQKMLALIEGLTQPIKQVDQEVEKQLVEMTLTLVREIINVELTTNQGIILSTLRDVVQSLPMSEQRVDVYLNPDDLKIVEQHYNKEAQQERNWHLIAEPQLSIGDIQVTCHQSQVDYNMQERVNSVMHQFYAANDQINRSQQIETDVVNTHPDTQDSVEQGQDNERSSESTQEV